MKHTILFPRLIICAIAASASISTSTQAAEPIGPSAAEAGGAPKATSGSANLDIAAIDRARILKAADAALTLTPTTITTDVAKHSAGGPNDFFSNADYFWPDPTKPDGLPYIMHDGQSNPENFNHHRMALRNLRDAVAALGAAYHVSGDDRYAAKAAELLRVFFIDPATRMNPHLNFAQAILGVVPGCSYGIIDSLHLIEIPVAIDAMKKSPAFAPEILASLKQWFHEYTQWLLTSKNGIKEAAAKNNHSVAYWLQVAAFARFTGDEAALAECRRQFKEVFVPNQMEADGSFPLELKRTKPYGYSIFQLDNMATLCQILSTPTDNLWNFELPDGRGIRKAVAYLYPFLADKSKWPLKPDIQAWDGWPARQSNLLFAGLALGDSKYLDLWKKLSPDPSDPEVKRNIAITQPLLWLAVPPTQSSDNPKPDVAAIDRARIIKAADAALTHAPTTITTDVAKNSTGGPNDFFSNADYFWPDPTKPGGLPYISRDGESNPENFNKHRMALRNLRDAVAALGAAYQVTSDDRYAAKAAELLRVFFLDPATRMNPHLNFAQAVLGVTPGRSYGIIDTLHLIEVPPAITAMQKSPAFSPEVLAGLKKWFRDYTEWMLTSKNGIIEGSAKNNHAVAFWLQVAAFARFTGDETALAEARRKFKEVFLVDQMALDGSFPLELKRTKPYAYSIFQFDNMSTLCQILSTKDDNLWTFELPDGRGIRKAVAYLYPYLADKSKWPLKPDIEAWESWPARQSGLLFAGIALGENKYLDLWQKLSPDPTNPEVQRNIGITQPLLWLK